jgi:hypothetical protein
LRSRENDDRRAASQALLRIDPEAAAKAGIKPKNPAAGKPTP